MLAPARCVNCDLVFSTFAHKAGNRKFCTWKCRYTFEPPTAIGWESVPGYSLYEARSDGFVRRKGSAENLAGGRNPVTGYRLVHLATGDGKRHMLHVHVIICMTFHGPRPSPAHQAAHFDGDPDNCDKDNLRWATRKENMADAKRHGRNPIDERNGHCRLTKTQIAEIRRRHIPRKRGINKALGKEFGVSSHHISEIVHMRKRTSGQPKDIQ